ncbi:hypothetical protein [Nocardioides sp. KR10-350]|uniref:hypothetical protein n=1 Tax=Nocardioides cheoyonin TaxID=3156615 RepID=UPI0032B5F666
MWLTKCEADNYMTTRRWAAWLLDELPDVAGFEYRCRHDEDRLAWVLYNDTLGGRSVRAAGALRASVADTRPLDSGSGLLLLNRVLADHNAVVEL